SHKPNLVFPYSTHPSAYFSPDFLNGIQPSDLLADFLLLTRHFNFAFLNCFLLAAYSSLIASTVWLCRPHNFEVPFVYLAISNAEKKSPVLFRYLKLKSLT